MNNKLSSWKILNSKVVYQTPWVKVTEDSVIRPDGKKGIHSVVKMKEGVSILPIDNENNVYLTLEFKYAVDKEMIEASSGGMDKGEDLLETAKRELKEELGITAKEWIYLGYVDPFTDIVYSPNHMYIARDLIFEKANPEGSEQIKVIKVPLKQAIEWVMESKITHGATSTLILKAKFYLKI